NQGNFEIRIKNINLSKTTKQSNNIIIKNFFIFVCVEESKQNYIAKLQITTRDIEKGYIEVDFRVFIISLSESKMFRE
ncbi:hypothetical protein, partial [Campylobacter sp. LR264d]|uniref:hypothetical protein n=1 Tax=Campylobacter sp. LR264d TaxID=2593544 RepID=UPI0016813800